MKATNANESAFRVEEAGFHRHPQREAQSCPHSRWSLRHAALKLGLSG